MLESTRKVDTVVLDKAGALEAASGHPIVRAVARASAERGELPGVEGWPDVEGLGVPGVVETRRSSSAAPGCCPTDQRR